MSDTTEEEVALFAGLMNDAPDAEAEETDAPQDEPEVSEDESEDDAPQDAEAEMEDGEDLDEDDESDDDTDDDESDDEDDEEDTEQLYTVKVDGEERQVTLDELQRGYSGQEYVQKGMAENANVKKALAEAIQAFQRDQQQFLEFAQRAQKEGFMAPPQRPDPAMKQTDPLGYMDAKDNYERDLEAYNAEQERLQQVKRQEQQAATVARQQYLRQQAELLAREIPEYADPKKREAFTKKLAQGAQEYYGLTPEVLEGVTDAFAVKMLRDAISYRELQSGKAKARKQRAPKPATKPQGKARPNPQRRAQQTLQTARKEQTDGAWAEVFKNIL